MQGALDAITYAPPATSRCLALAAASSTWSSSSRAAWWASPTPSAPEHDPTASRLLIDALACSLVGKVMDVTLVEGSAAQRAYGATSATERYYCRFGLNPHYVEPPIRGGLVISGTDQDGEARIVELPSRRFFVATLFVPQTSSACGAAHPLISAYLQAARQRAATSA
jgi:hypothetical protein